MTRITDRERAAVTALESIAERGAITCPYPDPENKLHRCPACQAPQHFGGPCANRECGSALARAALDELRRMS